MEILLIRHTTPKVHKGICYGQTNLDLKETYPQELKKIQKALSTESFFRVYSSPLKRCAILAKDLSNHVVYDDRLQELNFGDWEMQPWDQINSDELNLWMEDFVNEQVPNGESYLQLSERAISFVKELKNNGIEKAILITHAGFIRSLVAYTNKTHLKDSFDLKLAYGDHIYITL